MREGESEGKPIFSVRLEALLEEIIRAEAPNAGHFCGHCYNPLASEQGECAHCGLSVLARPPVSQIPPEVIDMFRAKRTREALPVRSLGYGGLALGLTLALLLMVLLPFWWNIVAFVLVLGVSYIAAANIANWLGDAIGYRWGQRTLQRQWREYVARRGF